MKLRNILWPRDWSIRGSIVLVCALSLVVGYGFRAVAIEVLRLAEVGLLIELLECAFTLASIAVWVYLIWKAFRLVRRPEPSIALLLAVIVAPLVSYLAPIPPAREEIRLWQRRGEYEAVALEVFARAEYHLGGCVASNAQERGLSEDCLQVSTNSVLFTVYDGVVFLVYSVDGKPPNDVYCGWDGHIWKWIDAHWCICKADLG